MFTGVQYEVGFVTPVAEGFYEIPMFRFLSAVLSKFVFDLESWRRISCSKVFMMCDIRATGLKSFSSARHFIFGTRTLKDVFHSLGSRLRLKILWRG